MSIIAILARDTGAVIFSGDYVSMRHCAEAAIAARVSLASADLTDACMANASMDGADLRSALLAACDFSGANLSECDLSGACARDCDFTLACLTESRISNVDFTGASFGSTIITDALIDDCRFTCPSVFTLDFASARLGRNIYRQNDIEAVFTAAPIVITGLPRRLVLLDDMALIGDRLVKRPDMPAGNLENLLKAYG